MLGPTTDMPSRVSADDFGPLSRVAGGRAWTAPGRGCREPAAKRFTQAAASKLVQRLVDARVVGQTRRVGRSQYYQVMDGAVSVALAQM